MTPYRVSATYKLIEYALDVLGFLGLFAAGLFLLVAIVVAWVLCARVYFDFRGHTYSTRWIFVRLED